jgi:hypothetical protein
VIRPRDIVKKLNKVFDDFFIHYLKKKKKGWRLCWPLWCDKRIAIDLLLPHLIVNTHKKFIQKLVEREKLNN